MMGFNCKQRLRLIGCLLFLSVINAPALAGPLTVETALSTAKSNHPDLLYAQACVFRSIVTGHFAKS